MARIAIIAGSVLMLFGVLIGAFGAHVLAELLEKNQRVSTFEIASRYHFYHALGLILIGVVFQLNDKLIYQKVIIVSLMLGVLFFSGSLYLLAILNLEWLGAIAPIGGSFFILAWGFLIFALLKHKEHIGRS